MTTETIFAVFEDFNEPRYEALSPAADEAPAPFDDIGQIREEAWTDGYLTGRQQAAIQDGDPASAAKLLTSVHALGASTSEAVDAASLIVADLLVDTIIAVTSGDWSARLMDRVRIVADRIKPALTVAPEFVLRDEAGAEHRFADISELSRAMENGAGAEDVSIRWQRGEATIGRTALLEDLRDAIIPLSAGRMNETHARQNT
jgi:hypothetical protein